jgi:hypothetical protein
VLRAVSFAFVVAGTLLASPPASAQTYAPDYPICMHVYGEQMGERMDCLFTSLAQCKATAYGLPAECLVNPYYAPELRRPRSERMKRTSSR